MEIIADTGSEEDLISHSDVEVHFKDKAKKIPSSPVSLITANGPVDVEAKHEVYIESLKRARRLLHGILASSACSPKWPGRRPWYGADPSSGTQSKPLFSF